MRHPRSTLVLFIFGLLAADLCTGSQGRKEGLLAELSPPLPGVASLVTRAKPSLAALLQSRILPAIAETEEAAAGEGKGLSGSLLLQPLAAAPGSPLHSFIEEDTAESSTESGDSSDEDSAGAARQGRRERQRRQRERRRRRRNSAHFVYTAGNEYLAESLVNVDEIPPDAAAAPPPTSSPLPLQPFGGRRIAVAEAETEEERLERVAGFVPRDHRARFAEFVRLNGEYDVSLDRAIMQRVRAAVAALHAEHGDGPALLTDLNHLQLRRGPAVRQQQQQHHPSALRVSIEAVFGDSPAEGDLAIRRRLRLDPGKWRHATLETLEAAVGLVFRKLLFADRTKLVVLDVAESPLATMTRRVCTANGLAFAHVLRDPDAPEAHILALQIQREMDGHRGLLLASAADKVGGEVDYYAAGRLASRRGWLLALDATSVVGAAPLFPKHADAVLADWGAWLAPQSDGGAPQRVTSAFLRIASTRRRSSRQWLGADEHEGELRAVEGIANALNGMDAAAASRRRVQMRYLLDRLTGREFRFRAEGHPFVEVVGLPQHALPAADEAFWARVPVLSLVFHAPGEGGPVDAELVQAYLMEHGVDVGVVQLHSSSIDRAFRADSKWSHARQRWFASSSRVAPPSSAGARALVVSLSPATLVYELILLLSHLKALMAPGELERAHARYSYLLRRRTEFF